MLFENIRTSVNQHFMLVKKKTHPLFENVAMREHLVATNNDD